MEGCVGLFQEEEEWWGLGLEEHRVPKGKGERGCDRNPLVSPWGWAPMDLTFSLLLTARN